MYVNALLAQPNPDLVAYYSFDNNDLSEATGIGGDGTAFGTLEYTNGIKGNALLFSGDDFVTFSGNVNNYFNEEDFTYSFFIKDLDLNRQQSILGKRAYCNGYNLFDARINATEELRCSIAGDSNNWQSSSINTTIEQECWEQITFVREGFNTYLYVNGELKNSGSADIVLNLENSADLSISNSPCIDFDGTQSLIGVFDELRVYSRALSSTEVAELFEEYSSEFTEACLDEPVNPPVIGIIPGFPTIISIDDLFDMGNIRFIKGGIRPVRFSMQLYDFNGNKVMESNDFELNLYEHLEQRSLSRGIYIYNVSYLNDEGKLETLRGKLVY